MMKVDHIGYVVKEIEPAIKQFTEIYQYSILKEVIYDPKQRVKLAMLASGLHHVELIQPIDATSPSYDFLQRGGGLHHICYRVLDIKETIEQLKRQNHLLFKKPIEAVLFSDRKVAFLYDKKMKQIIELVEEV